MIETAEFTFPMWLKLYEDELSHLEWFRVDPKVIQALVAYLNCKISDREAAESFAPALLERYKQLANTKPKKPGKEVILPVCPPDLLEYHEETLDRHLQLLMDAATRILHHQTQDSLVKLISALQQEALRQEDQLKVIRALKPNYECASKLPGLEEALGEEDSDSRNGSHDSDKPLYQAGWICVNAFYARLTAARLLRYEWAAALRCEDLIKALEESQEPHLISTFLCAAAQHVIYATPNVYSFCKLRADMGCSLEWDRWKKGFQRARQIQGLSKDAHWYSHLAVSAMERMEEKDLPKISQSFADLVAKLQEKSGGDKLLKLKASGSYEAGIWDTKAAPAVKKRRLGNSLSEISVS